MTAAARTFPTAPEPDILAIMSPATFDRLPDARVRALLDSLDQSAQDLLLNFERDLGSREAAVAKLKVALAQLYADEWKALKALAVRTASGR